MADRFQPPESVAGSPFWEASRDRRFVLPWCTDCGRPHWYPRGFCPSCLSAAIEWRPAAGTGVVHAVSVQPKTSGAVPEERAPYAVVLVDLDDGVRMMLQAADVADPVAVAVGDPVTVGWEPLDDGRHLPTAVIAGR